MFDTNLGTPYKVDGADGYIFTCRPDAPNANAAGKVLYWATFSDGQKVATMPQHTFHVGVHITDLPRKINKSMQEALNPFIIAHLKSQCRLAGHPSGGKLLEMGDIYWRT